VDRWSAVDVLGIARTLVARVGRGVGARRVIGLALAAGVGAAASGAAVPPRGPAAGQALGANQARAPEQPAATFRAGVELVAVDASVLDRNGRPVRDLGPEDFVLTVDGRPRRIASVQFVAHATETAPPAPAEPRVYGSNTSAPAGRLIMLVIDENHIRAGAGRAIVEATARFLDTLTPADRVGLAIIPGGTRVDFTANRALVKTLVANAVGRYTRETGRLRVGLAEALQLVVRNNDFVLAEMTERECVGPIMVGTLSFEDRLRECQNALRAEARDLVWRTKARTDETLVALRTILGRLALGPEAKTVVLVSEGLVLDDPVSQLAWVAPLAAAARATLYVLRLDGVLFDAQESRIGATSQDDQRLEIEGLEMLAGKARGALVRVGAGAERAFERLSLELSGYYLLSFEPEATDRDGRPHAIDLKVRREGVTVRARREFRVEPSPAERSPEERLAETLRSPLVDPEVPIRVTTYTFRADQPGKLKVMIAAEVDRSGSAAGEAALGYLLVDSNGRLAASALGLTLPSAEGTSGAWQPVAEAVLVDPGVYTLKLAVLEPDGRRGSVEHTFRAALEAAGQLRFADLLLAEVHPEAAPPVRPLVRPELETDVLHAYLEVYADASPLLESTTATVEIAAAPNGLALESSAVPFGPVEGGGRRAGETSVPVALLPPGDYVARAVVSVDGRPVARVTRPFRRVRAVASAVAAAEVEMRPAVPVVLGAAAAFRAEDVLDARVLAFFLDRLPGEAASSLAALRPALEAARAGRFAEVTAVLDRVDAGAAASPLAAWLRGIALFARGDLEAAAGRFREALRRSSEFLAAAFYLGACYAAGGRDREAIGAWQTALVTESDAAFIYTLLGDAYLRLGDGRGAREVLREARALWPADDAVAARLAAALAVTGDAAGAIATLDPYLERHPDDHARLLLALRLLYEAAAAGRAIESPERDRARFARYARAYRAAGGPEQALVAAWGAVLEGRR
jgi:VWFA-related protein